MEPKRTFPVGLSDPLHNFTQESLPSRRKTNSILVTANPFQVGAAYIFQCFYVLYEWVGHQCQWQAFPPEQDAHPCPAYHPIYPIAERPLGLHREVPSVRIDVISRQNVL